MWDGRTALGVAAHVYAGLTRKRDRQEVRARIIAAAQRLLDRNGTDAFTLSAVAAEAELARATVYSHFTSRRDLLSQLSPAQSVGELVLETDGNAALAAQPCEEELQPVSGEAVPDADVPAENEATATPAEQEPPVEPASEPDSEPGDETPRELEQAIAQASDPAEPAQPETKAEETVPIQPDVQVSSHEPAPDEQATPAVEEPTPAAGEIELAVEEAATAANEPAEAPAPAPAVEPEPVPVPGLYEKMMRAQAEAMDHLTRRVIVPKSLRREGTDSVLSRIEARLSIAEKSHAALDQSVGGKLKGASDQLAMLASSLEETKARLEKFEERQQAVIAELRLDLLKLGRRAEPAMSASIAEAAANAVPSNEPVFEAFEQKPAEESPAAGRVQSYLCSARAAAIQAAEKVAAKPKPARASWRKLMKRWRWPLIVAASVVVASFDAYVVTHGAPAPVAVSDASAVPLKHRVLTPAMQLARGLQYLNGTGVATNVEKAARYLERAARAGLPVAQNYMGVLYQTGTGVRANMATAVAWYEAAARSGNLKAMTNLGKAYAGGWSEGTDFAKAAEWFGRAAGFGDIDAEFDLAVLYERGAGVTRSLPDAYKWYVIAGAHGDAHAAERATVLASQLSPNDLLAAQAAAALFRPAQTDNAANDIPR